MELKDDFLDKLRKDRDSIASMITRTALDDFTTVDMLDFVKDEHVINVQLIKEDLDIIEVVLYFNSGRKLSIYHEQDCCEDVSLIDVIGGNIDDLVGQKIESMKSVCRQSDEIPFGLDDIYLNHSNTWTFVTISTFKDDITLRWHGGSNGYYSEYVDFAYYDENNKRLY